MNDNRRKGAVLLATMVSFCLMVLGAMTVYAQPRATAVSPRKLALKTARVLRGPDPAALYVQLQTGEPRIRNVSLTHRYLKQGEVWVSLEDFATDFSPGNPMLPYQIYHLALPPEADPASLKFEITRIETKEIPGRHRVAAAPPRERCQDLRPDERAQLEVERWDEGKKIVDGKNVLVYEQDTLYPLAHCVVTYGGQLRKWKIASVTFYPVRYNPVSGELVLAREIDLKITFTRDPAYLKKPKVKELLADEKFDGRAREILINYEGAKQWYHKPLLEGPDSGKKPKDKTGGANPSDPDYAIITTETTFTQNIGATGSLDDFCFHKENLGFEVLVLTEHTTRTVEKDASGAYAFAEVSGVGGYEDVVGAPAPNHRPDKIYKWVKDNYLTLGIEYVLLIGDPDPDNPGADHVGDLPMKMLLNNVPSDFYFAELTGNWDFDGDGNAGEHPDDRGIGGVEFFADLTVGRIPCYDEDQDGNLDYGQLNHILDKIIACETAVVQDNPWRRGVLTACPYVADTDGDGIHDVAKYEWSEMLRDGVAPPPLWDWYRIYEEAYPGLSAPAEVDTGCSTAATEAGWNDPANPDDGRGTVMWMTHGEQTSATKVFNNARCGNLDDTKPAMVFMGACYNGEPELNFDALGNTVISLGYANLKNGAVATISASRESYG